MSAAASPSIVLPEDARCYGCQYNLVGRKLDEKCPECGMDVAPSWPMTDVAAGHPVFLSQLVHECRSIWVISLLAWMFLAAGAVVATLATTPLGPTIQKPLMITAGVAAWCYFMTPIFIQQANKRVSKHPNSMRMPGAYERWNMQVGGKISALGIVAFFVVGVVGAAMRSTTGLWFVAGCLAIMAIGVLAWLLAAWTYTGSVLARSGRTVHAQWLENTRLPIVVSLGTSSILGVLSWKTFPASRAIVPWCLVVLGTALVWRAHRAWRTLAGLRKAAVAAL